MRDELVIVGGSYAACEIASAARSNGYDGNVRIITEEPELPYHRPPLSKAFLLEESNENGLPLKSEAFYRDNNIDIEFNVRATRIDRITSTVHLFDGRAINFDKLALATGARARKLAIPGADLNGIIYLRSVADARALKREAANATNVVIIGGGFIGLEVASALVQQDKNVTVLEMQPDLLTRVVAPPISRFLAASHIAHDVTLMTNARVMSLAGHQGLVRRVVLEDRRTIDADLVIVGIGTVPNIELATSAGIACGDGIVVDPHGQTSLPGIFAAGDCAFYDGPFTKGGMRLESVQNAIDQSRAAGAATAGVMKAYNTIPWFWSDQFKLKLQIAGVSKGFDDYAERPGGDNELSVFYFKDEYCIAVDSINRPRDHMTARRLLPQGNLTKETLAEVDFNISALMSGASAILGRASA